MKKGQRNCVSNLDISSPRTIEVDLSAIMKAGKDIFTAMPSMLASIINQTQKMKR